jgi:hypothetical protein
MHNTPALCDHTGNIQHQLRFHDVSRHDTSARASQTPLKQRALLVLIFSLGSFVVRYIPYYIPHILLIVIYFPNLKTVSLDYGSNLH